MTDNQIALVVFFVLVVILLANKGRSRSRHIPTAVKRQALGKFYDRYYSDPNTRDKRLRKKDYEFDHHVPFSKGGSHAAANIEVISKKKNRKKGAKMPSFWDRF